MRPHLQSQLVELPLRRQTPRCNIISCVLTLPPRGRPWQLLCTTDAPPARAAHLPHFRQILIGGLLGDPDFDDNTGDGVIDRAITAGPTDAVANSVHSTIVSLPDKTCNYCTVQWYVPPPSIHRLPPRHAPRAGLLHAKRHPTPCRTWAARADGGFYMGCSDIAITSTGACTAS